VTPRTAEIRNAIKAPTNTIFAVAATTPKPSVPAMRAMTRKAVAQPNIMSS
jgi:hypothetical protein